MTNFTQIPGALNITATINDDFSFGLDFDISLSGYSFSAQVVSISSGTLIPMTVTNTDLALGKVNISLDKTAISSLGVAQHHWYFQWVVGSQTRRILAGTFTIVNYP
jgi:hypothetical protein